MKLNRTKVGSCQKQASDHSRGHYIINVRKSPKTSTNSRLMIRDSQKCSCCICLEFTSVITGNDGEVYIYGLFRAAK